MQENSPIDSLTQSMNLADVRADFPILSTVVDGRPLVYFDNAATSQKPKAVIERLQHYYAHENANVHRGLHHLAEMATSHYEAARDTVQAHLNAVHREEIIWVRGATEGINLVAHGWGRKNIEAGDEIIVTELEHHANFVPWQQLCIEKGAKLVVLRVPTESSEATDAYWLEQLEQHLSERTKLLSIVHISNSLGCELPAPAMVQRAKERGITTLIDGCQSSAHLKIDMQALGCDFYVFSGHKVCAPTGIGVLYGRLEMLEQMTPYQLGGDMIDDVSIECTTYNVLPMRLEAGTPNIAGAIGLAAALDYLNGIGYEAIVAQEEALRIALHSTMDELEAVGVRRIERGAVVLPMSSFIVEGIHTYDLATYLAMRAMCLRDGNHCTQPLFKAIGVSGTMRASLAFYNTVEEIALFKEAMQWAISKLRR